MLGVYQTLDYNFTVVPCKSSTLCKFEMNERVEIFSFFFPPRQKLVQINVFFMTTCVAWAGSPPHSNYRQVCLHNNYNGIKTMLWYSLRSCVFALIGADHPELHAQVPAQVPHSAGQRHPEAPLQHLQDLRLPGDRVRGCDSLSERQGTSVYTLNQLPLIGLLYFA